MESIETNLRGNRVETECAINASDKTRENYDYIFNKIQKIHVSRAVQADSPRSESENTALDSSSVVDLNEDVPGSHSKSTGNAFQSYVNPNQFERPNDSQDETKRVIVMPSRFPSRPATVSFDYPSYCHISRDLTGGKL